MERTQHVVSIILIMVGLILAGEGAGTVEVTTEGRPARIELLTSATALQKYLQSDDRQLRLAAVDRLAEIGGMDSVQILKSFYESFSDDIWTTAGDPFMSEKERTLAALGKIDPDCVEYMVKIVKKQIQYAAHMTKGGWPSGTINAAANVLVEKAPQTLLSEFGESYKDKRLPVPIRWILCANTTAARMQIQNIESVHDKVLLIVAEIQPPPIILSIPSDVYSDKEKRIEYGNSEPVLRECQKLAEHFRSDDGVYQRGLRICLRGFGRPAVDDILVLVHNEDFSKGKSDDLVELAADILSRHTELSGWSDKDSNVFSKIEEYLVNMEPTGLVFDKRYNVKRCVDAIRHDQNSGGNDESEELECESETSQPKGHETLVGRAVLVLPAWDVRGIIHPVILYTDESVLTNAMDAVHGFLREEVRSEHVAPDVLFQIEQYCEMYEPKKPSWRNGCTAFTFFFSGKETKESFLSKDGMRNLLFRINTSLNTNSPLLKYVFDNGILTRSRE